MASTGAAVQFLTELLTGKDVTGTQAEMWITSLALIHHPTLEMLENVKVRHNETFNMYVTLACTEAK